MKKFWKMMLVAVMTLTAVFGLVGCGNTFEAKAIQIVGADVEAYGIAVEKGQDADLLAEINKVIADWTAGEQGKNKIDQLVDYYQDVYEENDEAKAPFTVYLKGDENASSSIIMATESGFAPFEFIDGEQIVGVDVAIMGQVAKNLGKKLEIIDVNFESLTASIFSRADVIAAGFTATDERKQSMDFSDTYFTSTQYIVCAKDSEIKSLEDLKGLAIGAQTGTTGALLVDKEIREGVLKDSGAALKEYKNAPVAFEDLKKGTIKAIVLDSVPAISLVAKSAK